MKFLFINYNKKILYCFLSYSFFLIFSILDRSISTYRPGHLSKISKISKILELSKNNEKKTKNMFFNVLKTCTQWFFTLIPKQCFVSIFDKNFWKKN